MEITLKTPQTLHHPSLRPHHQLLTTADEVAMPPPPNSTLSPTLRDQLNALLAEASQPTPHETVNPKRIKGNPAHAAALVAHHVALIVAWSKTLTPAQRHRRYSLEEICTLAKLPGQRNDAPPAQWAIGPALRNAGFEPRRDWTANGRNRRYWQLPDVA
jgi:hypothetical protein